MTGQVTQSEGNLVLLARTAVGAASASEVMRLLVSSVAPPPKLGPTARSLLADTLARGTTASLVRGGGWKREGGKRLWERMPGGPTLHFGPNLIRFFQWMLKTPLAERDVAPLVLHEALTPGEEVVVTLLFERLKGTSCEQALARQSALRTSPLVVLAHCADLSRVLPLERVPPVRPAEHAVAIEGLRDVFARSWFDAEQGKRLVDKPAVLSTIGQAQAAVLESFLRAVVAVPHRPMATFLIDAAAAFVTTARRGVDTVAALDPDAPLRERSEARKQAGAFVRGVLALRAWDQEHRSIRFIDDDYDVAQRLVASWEVLGDRGFRELERLRAELEELPG